MSKKYKDIIEKHVPNTIGYIYEFTNKTNNKKYIGQTWYIKRRIASHKNGTGYAKLLKSALAKYGFENFIIKILFMTTSQAILDNAEIISINLSKSLAPNGYNLALGGSHGKFSDATKKLIGSYHKNKIVSLETRQKLRERNQNQISPQTRQLIAASLQKHYKDNEKFIYIFNCFTHVLVDTYKNIRIASEQTNIAVTVLYGSISAKSKFKYAEQYCYASYTDIPLQKQFRIGTPVDVIKSDGSIINFNSIAEATKSLHINRGIISELVRGNCKKSSYVDNGVKVYFTAKYAYCL
jgi:group I intron endonuclease